MTTVDVCASLRLFFFSLLSGLFARIANLVVGSPILSEICRLVTTAALLAR